MLSLLALLPIVLAVQEPPTPSPPTPAPAERPAVDRLERWPVLEGEAKAKLKLEVERLRKARTPEMAAEAEAALIEAGAACAPELLPVLGREKDAECLARARRVLETVCGAEHTRLLAASFADKAPEVRVQALLMVARHPDPGVRGPAEAALARALKAAKPDREEQYAAALCAVSAGSLAGFDTLAGWAETAWGKRGAAIRTALEAVRGPEATAAAAKLLESGERKHKVTALNLLAGCGAREATAIVKPYLDSDDNSLRVAAINAMRGIVEGAPPLADLAVFEAIELAKAWKQRS